MRAAALLLLIARTAHAGVDDDPAGDADRAWCDGRAIAYDEGARVGPRGLDRVFVRRAHQSCRGGASWVLAIGAGWTGGRVAAVAWDRSGIEELWRRASAVVAAPACGADRDPTDVAVRAGGAVRRCAAFLDRDVAGLAHALDTPAPRHTLDDEPTFFLFTDEVE